MAQIKTGSKAPDFKLLDQNEDTISLKNIKEEYIVLFFYPKDNTPGCTLEAQAFTKNIKKFQKLNAKVIGISGGNVKSKAKFCEKAELDVTLLSDEDNSVGEKYDTFGEKKFMGRTYNGYHRKTFLIGSDKKILKIYDKVKPEEHADEILNDIKSKNF